MKISGNDLRLLRFIAQCNRDEMAKRLGIATQYLVLIENGYVLSERRSDLIK